MEDAAYVPMRHHPSELDLAPESLDRDGVRGDLGVQGLEGDRLGRGLVPGLVNFADRPLADETDDRIPAL
jgi:hypothetical protein